MGARNNTYNRIIEKGAALIHRKGYNATGLKEILQKAGVPKGSFYFYFESKEDFGIEVINYFSSTIESFFKQYLLDKTVPPLKRFENLVNFYVKMFEKSNFSLGCPIGNLSLEMADTNKRFKSKLSGVVDNLIVYITLCLKEAQEDGSIRKSIHIDDVAKLIFYGFEGAILHMKLVNSSKPLITFYNSIINYLTK